MSTRVVTYLLAAAAAAVMLAATAGAAAASSAAPAAKLRVVPIVMKDPGCHWFQTGGKTSAKLAVSGKTAFRNLDEAALVFKGKNFVRRLAVGKTLTVAKRGVYHITMVGQHPDDNTLALVVS